MANGIDYFPLDVNFFDDDKIALIESEFGIQGSYIALRLLCKIYREGYYYQWGGDECLLFARKAGAGIVPNLVKEVVNGLVKRSFFDKGVFDRFGILTSRGIQLRYFEASRRRQRVIVKREFLLVDVSKYPNVYISDENVYIEPKNVYIPRQSKVKESKVKENKSLSISPSLQSGDERPPAEPSEAERERIFEIFFFEKNCKNPQKEFETFIHHYEANGWCRKDSTVPVKDRLALARNWKTQSEDKYMPENVIKWLFSAYIELKKRNIDLAKQLIHGGISQVYSQNEVPYIAFKTKELGMSIAEFMQKNQPNFKLWLRVPKM